jgi:hypothetical protein
MRPYVVIQGDYLEKLAQTLGFDPDEVWNDPKNADLARLRDPNRLYPGDILYVPDREETWLPLRDGTANLYIAKTRWTTVRLVFPHLLGEPYVIRGLGEPQEGTTSGEGEVEIKVPVHVREVQILFPGPNITFPVHVGDMDPIEEQAGVRKRLQNLGFYEEPAADDGEGDEEAALQAAIHAFQMDNDLLPTGTLDEETKAKLLERYGS